MGIFGTFFSIQANIITNIGPDSRIDMSGGIFIRGFSIEIYPDFYSPNIIPALSDPKMEDELPGESNCRGKTGTKQPIRILERNSGSPRRILVALRMRRSKGLVKRQCQMAAK